MNLGTLYRTESGWLFVPEKRLSPAESAQIRDSITTFARNADGTGVLVLPGSIKMVDMRKPALVQHVRVPIVNAIADGSGPAGRGLRD